MESRTKSLIFSYSIFILFTLIPAQSQNTCRPDSCSSDPYHGPLIRFPFRLKHRQGPLCGYPGFDLHCNTRNQTIIHLPGAGEFIVDYIDYARQALFIVDPDSCLPNRALNFSLSGSPFRASRFTKFAFYNCSGSWPEYESLSDDYEPLFCFGERNNIVLASSPVAKAPPRCQRMANISVPPRWRYPVDQADWWFAMEFELVWNEPHCRDCEDRAGDCGLIGDSGLLIGCSNSKSSRRGVPRSGKYAIIVGVGIPGLLCIIGLACYLCRLIKTKLQQDRPNPELPTTTVFHQQSIIRAANGLDLPTIESYPKMLLGQSCRLPRPSDNTCHICLSEYQPKETLRSIPECNHYFHVGCIDEWLKLNGTCPVCRTLPERSSIPTSCLSTSSLIGH